MEKSRDAFRTISEVAGWLDVPTHVLRFWESRFSQIKPVKRAGGRRYYRPSDMSLIGGIKTLLHDQGMTIRGVQKMLREQGIKHVSSFSPPLHPEDEIDVKDDGVIEGTAVSLQPTERPVSIPAPAARATHVAEPTPEDDDTEPAVPQSEVGEEQPDMFPESSEDQPEDAPVFLHRRPPSSTEDGGSAAPTKVFPTPNVPDQDPDDDDGREAAKSVSAKLLGLERSELEKRKEVLGSVAEQLKQLRQRMAE